MESSDGTGCHLNLRRTREKNTLNKTLNAQAMFPLLSWPHLYGYGGVGAANDAKDGPGGVELEVGGASPVGALVLVRVKVVEGGPDELERLVERVGVAAAGVQDVDAQSDASVECIRD